MTNEKVVERIKKLMALSTSDNEHEAKLAMEHASRLMEEHQISMAEVELQDMATRKEEVVTEYWQVPGLKMKYNWVQSLAHAAAILYDAEVLCPRALHGTRILWIGYKGDIEMAKTTFEHLWRSWQRFVVIDLNRAKRDTEYRYTPRDTMKFKLGHGQGYAWSLVSRAKDLAKARKEKVSASGETGTALVVVKEAEVNKVVEARCSGRPSRSKLGSTEGFMAGGARGKSVALGGEIKG
jgi:hypothetical protein